MAGQKRVTRPYERGLEKVLAKFPASARLAGLTLEERLAGLTLEERLDGLTSDEKQALLQALQAQFENENTPSNGN